MKYIRTIFRVCPYDELTCELLAAIAYEHGYDGFEHTSDGITGYIPASLYSKEMVDIVLSAMPVRGRRIEYSSAPLDDIDWNASWEEQGFDPIIVSDECIVVDARHLPGQELTRRYPFCITIRATQSFGTGTHATTQMMLRSLMQADLKGKHVVDCGCGTGILSIAAMLKGAAGAVAFDIDPWSVDTAKHNAGANGVEIDIREGGCEVIADYIDTADVLVANINRNIILADIGSYIASVKTGGTLLFSGFLNEDGNIITEKAQNAGLMLTATMTEGDWMLLQFVKF